MQVRCPARGCSSESHATLRTDDMRCSGLGRSGLGVGELVHTMREMSLERQTIRAETKG